MRDIFLFFINESLNLGSSWLYEELLHHEKVYQMTISFPSPNVPEIIDKFKLKTDLSVSQFAYFVRILLETGIFKNQNQKEFISFFAKHTRTKRADKISVSSFHNKYYNIDFSTKEDIREEVIKLLNETQKDE